MVWAVETDDFHGKCGQGTFPLLTEAYNSIRKETTTTSESGTTTPTSQPVTTSSEGQDSTTDYSSPIIPAEDKFVVCYYSSWAIYREGDGNFEVDDIDPDLCTHIIYAFAGLNETTNKIVSLDPWCDFEDGLDGYGNFTRLANRNPGLKALLAIGGWSEGSEKYSKMANDSSTRAIFVQSAVEFILEYEFDGLDLDWEYPANRGGAPEDKENFALLVSELRQVRLCDKMIMLRKYRRLQ